MAQTQSLEQSLAENAIVDLVSEYPVYGGGGKGQTATAAGVTAKGTSRTKAAEALLAALQGREVLVEETPDGTTTVVAEKVARERRNAADVLASLQAVFPGLEWTPAEDDAQPTTLWSGDYDSISAVVPCVPECMDGHSNICDCKCQGANHGISGAGFLAAWPLVHNTTDRVALLQSIRPVVLGSKMCACGCGMETFRRFVPGHDARYHGRILRERQAAERGITVEEVPAALRRERAARRKAAKVGAAA